MATCLVLGAGASLANALHFHSERRTARNPPLDYTFFEKIHALGITIPIELRRYAGALGRADPFASSATSPAMRMEEFFKDLFSDFQDAPRDSPVARAYEQLIDIYVRVMRETTNWITEDRRRGGPVGALIAAAAECDDRVTLLTFNHDLVIENEILKRSRLSRRWCLEKGYGTFSSALEFQSARATNRRLLFPNHSADCDHVSAINVLKLHGSLNWYIRMRGQHPSRSVLSGEGQLPTILCSRRRAAPHQLRWVSPPRKGPGRTRWYTWPIVVPPVHGKEMLIRRFVPEVWADAETALTEADRIIFFGYSLPMLDVHAERLFKRSIASNTNAAWVDVVNPSPTSAERYASIATPVPVRWYPSIESFLTAGDLTST